MKQEWMENIIAMQPIEELTNRRRDLFARYDSLPVTQLPWHKGKPHIPECIYDFSEESGHVYNFIDTNYALLAVTEEGDLVAEELQQAWQGQLFCGDLFQALLQNKDIFLPYFGQLMTDDTKEGAFHYMMVNHGMVLYIPDNVVVEEPILLKAVLQNSKATHVTHLLIIIGHHSQVTLIDDMEVNGERDINRVTEVFVSHDSHVNYQRSYVGKNKGYHYDEWVMRLAAHSHCDYHCLHLEEEDAFFKTTFLLDEVGAEVNVHEISMTTSQATLTLNTTIQHHAPHTIGHMVQKGVANQKSTLNLNAFSTIQPHCTQSNASQSLQLLLMDATSRGEANPKLDIQCHEVKASHGAVISQMDEQLRYYLMSRGLTKEAANRLYVEGMLKDSLPPYLVTCLERGGQDV